MNKKIRLSFVLVGALGLMTACGKSSEDKTLKFPKVDSLSRIKPKFSEPKVELLNTKKEMMGLNAKNRAMVEDTEANIREQELSVKKLQSDIQELSQKVNSLENKEVSLKKNLNEKREKANASKFQGDYAEALREKYPEASIEVLNQRENKHSENLSKYQEIQKRNQEELEKLDSKEKELEKKLGSLSGFEKISDSLKNRLYENLSFDLASVSRQLSEVSKERVAIEDKQKRVSSEIKIAEWNINRVKEEKKKRGVEELGALGKDLADISIALQALNQDLTALQKELSSKNEALDKTRDLLKKQKSAVHNYGIDGLIIEKKLMVIESIQAGKKPELKDLLEINLMKHTKELLGKSGDKTWDEVDFYEHSKKILLDISDSSPRQDLGELKKEYESILQKKYHDGKLLVYNASYTSLLDPIWNQRVQCSSGTNLYIMMAMADLMRIEKQKQDEDLFNETMYQKSGVVIFESGHMLPGRVEIKNNRLELVGVETTASGKAEILFGETSDIAGKIRVVDVSQYLLVQALQEEISNPEEIFSQVQETIRLYGFVPDRMEAYSSVDKSNTGDATAGSTMFSFDPIVLENVNVDRSPIGSMSKASVYSYKKKQEEIAAEKRRQEEVMRKQPNAIPMMDCRDLSQYFDAYYYNSRAEEVGAEKVLTDIEATQCVSYERGREEVIAYGEYLKRKAH